jgi:hypothetical protein
MAYRDLVAELVGRVPGLSAPLAQTFIKRAWLFIRNDRRWSFLWQEGVVICPAQVTTGVVAIIQGSNQVATSATASAALAGLGLALTQCQIRFPSQGLNQIYNIVAAQGNPLVLTLDRVVIESSSGPQGIDYQVYRCYIAPPVPDFKGWVTFRDANNGYDLRWNVTSIWFDQRDPQRQAQGEAYKLGYYQAIATYQPLYELWPHPTQGQIFLVKVARRGVDFSRPGDQQPPGISDAMILSYALASYVYPHMQANIGLFPKYKGVNFSQLIKEELGTYLNERRVAVRDDDEIALQSILDPGHLGLRTRGPRYDGPIDANFMQRHPVTW